MAYPNTLDNIAADKTDATDQVVVHAAHHNDLADAVNAIEGELGLTPSGGQAATVAERLDLIESDVDSGDAALTAHAADSTAVHGIADTAALVLTNDARLSDARTPTAHQHPQSDITGLVGALAAKQDASTAATDAELASAVATLNAAVALKQDASTAATDAELATEATARASGDSTNAAAAAAAQTTANAALPKAGGTMTGALVLAGDAAANLQPVTLQQLNAAVAALINGAPGALDTLKELADQLATDESAVTALAATVAGKLAAASNLSDLQNAVTARTNLGLGSAATHAHSDYDAAGAAAAVQAASQPLDADLTALAALTTTSIGRSLLAAVDAAALRTILALGSAATQASTAFDASGAAAAAQAASQPLDGDLTDFGALSPSNDDIPQRKSGHWTNRTPAQFKTDLSLVQGDVGLGSVDNTADTAKPVSSAQQTALDLKAERADVQVFTANGTWTKPAGAKAVRVILIGSGGGGGSGRRGAAGTVRCGGGSGGGAGLTDLVADPAELGATVAVTIGAAGAGGAAVTVDDTNGNPGAAGAITTFGTMRAGGGGAGGGGTTGAGAGGAAGTGTNQGVAGVASSGTGANGTTANSATNGGGQAGGSGAGVTAANGASTGGSSAAAFYLTNAAASGGSAGNAGQAGTDSGFAAVPGIGGGGGGSALAGNAGAGGNAGKYGSGGGGGGGVANGFNSGKGGDGSDGRAVIITYF